MTLQKDYLANWGIIKVSYYLAVLTVSFDIFLVLNIGFNFRATQVFLMLPMAVAISEVLTKGKIKWPAGFLYLIWWTSFILAFIPNTNFLLGNIGDGFWLIFSVLLVLATVQLFGVRERIVNLIKWYLYSFFFIAAFGLIQFIGPILHLEPPLVTQWWIPGLFPRINGFSYEPSYFATYILIGWVLSIYLLQTESKLIKRQHLKVIFITLTLAMILSSSRMGWFMMILWFLQYPVLFLYDLVKGRINKQRFKYALILAFISVLSLAILLHEVSSADMFLLSGTGISSSPSHSLDSRASTFFDVIKIFTNSPLVGYSLGGISPAIADLYGIKINSLELAKQYEGMSVFAEVLAASGVVGFIPFTLYIATLLIRPIKLAKKAIDPEIKKLLMAMMLSLLFELIILQFNQTILRPYLWLHIAILSALLYSSTDSSKVVKPNANNYT